MTNKEKFEDVFGREANINECPIYCHTTDGDKCPCYKNKCYSGKWWGAEYIKEENKEVELAIKIDEKLYEHICKTNHVPDMIALKIRNAIKNGRLLTK